MFNKIFENVGERLGHISRAGVLAIAVGALLVIPNAALAKGKVQSDNGTEWFSEESGGGVRHLHNRNSHASMRWRILR